MRRCLVLPLTATLAVLGAGAAAAAAGDLDPGWSGDGVQTQEDGAFAALATAPLPGGALLVAGTGRVDDGSVSSIGTYAARYTSAGTLDAAYGSAGVRKISIASGAEVVRDVVVDSAGRALVAGYVAAPDYPDETDLFVLRLTPSGAPDASFGGGDGIVTIDRTNHDRGGALALSGNRILLGAGLDAGGNFGLQWTVFALDAGGALDSGFSGDGTAQLPVDKVGSFDGLRDLAVQKDGKILLGGASGNEFASARLTAGGVLDPSWSGDGVARELVDGSGAGCSLLLQPDGKVVVAGYATVDGRSDTDLAAVRWTPTGALDGSFGGDGKVTVDMSAGTGPRTEDRAQAAALAADSKIVLVGSRTGSTGADSAVARLDWDGSPDTSFSDDGLAWTSTLATSNEQLETVSVLAGDKVRTGGADLEGWTLLGWTGGAPHLLSVADAALTEPDTGKTGLTFTVRLATPSTTPVTVRWAAQAGTATTPGDFSPAGGVLTFPAGTTSRTLSVPVVGDTTAEPTETFRVVLSKPTNAGLGDATAVGTVRNDD